MSKILEIVLAKVGWKKILKIAWAAGYSNLKEAAKKTDAKWDDEAVEVANDIVNAIIID